MSKSVFRFTSINPVLVLLTLRAARAVQARLPPGPPEDLWSLAPGLRVARSDPDRQPAQWLEGWHEDARENLDKAWHSALVQGSLAPVEAAALIDTQHAAEGPEAAGACVCMLPSTPPKSGWPPQVLHALAEEGATPRPRWLDVPAGAGQEWWTEHHYNDSLRWGVGWWFQPPAENAGWAAYSDLMEQVSHRVVRHLQSDQWVWPWTDLMQQAMEECLRSGTVTARCGGPWTRKRPGEWGKLRRTVWQSASQAMAPYGTMEDLMTGVLCHARQQGWTL